MDLTLQRRIHQHGLMRIMTASAVTNLLYATTFEPFALVMRTMGKTSWDNPDFKAGNLRVCRYFLPVLLPVLRDKRIRRPS